MAGFYEQKDQDGITIGWQAKVRRKGYPTQTKVFRAKREAEAWARSVESEMDRRIFSPPVVEHRTLGDLLSRYANEVTPGKRGAEPERYRIEGLLRYSLSAMKITTVTGKDIAEWRDQRAKEVAPATVNRDMTVLSHVFEIARKEWGIPVANPCRDVRRLRPDRPRDRRLVGDEEARLLAAIDSGGRNPWLKPVVLFALETAMRQGEIVGLTWADIDLAKPWARIREAKNGEGRVVPLSTRAVAILKLLQKEREQQKEHGPVFPTSSEAIKQSWQRACNRAGIEDLTFHDLRHEATSRLFEKGLNPMQVASITGHKTLQMLKRYTHLRAEDLAKMLG
ncbi:site-specific integrase [Acidithiobacillus sp.]